MLATFIPSVFADEVSEATSEGTIKVGINAEFPPFEYYEDGKLTGFDIDLMNYIG
ncbi:MAG: transporter substrate-binding domain-containing protein, partial [Clostridia bacterium]|nr:transporter substrate-binding domain-containing protein [Clostridia bacterium]